MTEDDVSWIESLIVNFVRDYPASVACETRWRTPLVAAARADDPAFALLRESVSATHALPTDILPGAASVIAYFIPFDASIAEGNREGTLASPGWARAYVETNALIGALNRHARAALAVKGHQCSEIPATHNFNTRTLLSDWSHRHVARIAGLGSFGLNNMLITESGCCGRLGSLVTDMPGSDPAENRAGRPAEFCLRSRNGSCGICLTRCVNGALNAQGYDRHLCYDQCLRNAEVHAAIGYCDVCGKCLAGLPCSSRAP